METLIVNDQEKVEFGAATRQLIEAVVAAAVATAQAYWRENDREPEEWVAAVLAAPDAEVSIALVDDEAIHKLNKDYRQIDRPTDVLSFPMGELPVPGGAMLGDIIISLETAERQAVDYGHGTPREVGFLTAHGMLHLMGFDHLEPDEQAEMRRLEEAVLDRLDLRR